VSDNVCVSSPCNHNGTCHVTWNDFWCQCPRGYTGKTCQEMEFCQLQDCPSGSRCQNLDDGYECIANATFDGISTAFTYVYDRIDENANASDSALDTIEITYRSNTGGTLLHMAPHVGDQHFTVSVLKDTITVSWRLDVENQDLITFGKAQSDGNWTSLLIKLNNNSLECGFANPTEESFHMSSNFNFHQWYNLLVMGTVTLGGLSSTLSDRHSYVTVGSKHERKNGIEGNSVDYNEHRLTTAMPPHSMMSGKRDILIQSFISFTISKESYARSYFFHTFFPRLRKGVIFIYILLSFILSFYLQESPSKAVWAKYALAVCCYTTLHTRKCIRAQISRHSNF